MSMRVGSSWPETMFTISAESDLVHAYFTRLRKSVFSNGSRRVTAARCLSSLHNRLFPDCCDRGSQGVLAEDISNHALMEALI